MAALLDKFVCEVSNATPLLRTIVAPRLAYIEHSPDNEIYSEFTVFTELSSKFSSVSHLVLRCTHLQFKQEGLRPALPDVRHMELLEVGANAVFECTLPSSAWQHLEYLSIDSEENYYEDRTDQVQRRMFWGGLSNWLQLRRGIGQSVLRVKISSFSGDVPWISNMHDALHGLCVLDREDNAFKVSIGLSGLVNEFSHILLISGLMASLPISATRF